MRFLFFSLLALIITPIFHDCLTLGEFDRLVSEYQPKVEQALSDEDHPGLILPDGLRYVCHSGCFDEIESDLISYSLMGTKPLFLSSRYPTIDLVYHRN